MQAVVETTLPRPGKVCRACGAGLGLALVLWSDFYRLSIRQPLSIVDKRSKDSLPELQTE